MRAWNWLPVTVDVKSMIKCVLLAAAMGTAAGGGMVGCETMGQDIRDLGSIISPRTPAEASRDMFNMYDADKRREGLTLISNASFGGAEVYVAAYRDMVANERDPVVKALAIRALAKHGRPEDALLIVQHLRLCENCVQKNQLDGLTGAAAANRRVDCQSTACRSDNVQVRWEVAKGLQRLHNPEVVPDLISLLRDNTEHTDVRIAAAVALGQYPEDRVVQSLVGALDARELAINMAAEQSLHTLTGQSFDMEPRRWLNWYNQAVVNGEAFAGGKEYLYPTYSRRETIWDKLAFWTSRNYEQPAPPAGLRPQSERSTYED